MMFAQAQRHNRLLYMATGGGIVLSLLLGIGALLTSLAPTADVVVQEQFDRYVVDIASYEPGEVRRIEYGKRLIMVWRRSPEEMTLAAQQLREFGPVDPMFDNDLYAEWLILVPISDEAFAGRLEPKFGDYGGLFDTSRGSHFDLYGRARPGPGWLDLTLIPAVYSEDQTSIILDLRTIEELSRRPLMTYSTGAHTRFHVVWCTNVDTRSCRALCENAYARSSGRHVTSWTLASCASRSGARPHPYVPRNSAEACPCDGDAAHQRALVTPQPDIACRQICDTHAHGLSYTLPTTCLLGSRMRGSYL